MNGIELNNEDFNIGLVVAEDCNLVRLTAGWRKHQRWNRSSEAGKDLGKRHLRGEDSLYGDLEPKTSPNHN